MNGCKPCKTQSLTRVQPQVMPPPGEAGQYTNKLHYLRKYLLDELITKKYAMDFMEPVDAAALQVPNYYTTITRPMDVGTIIKRVHNRFYHRVDELIRDFRLVISNCFTFNQPGDVVYRNCQRLEKFFHRVLNKMPRGEEKPSKKDPRGSGSEKNSEAVQRQCRELLRKLQICISNEDDKSIHKYFNKRLEILSQIVDTFDIRTVEEFRFEVNAIFQEFDVQVRKLYEFSHRLCEDEPLPVFDRCQLLQDHSNSPHRQQPILNNQDVNELLCTLKCAESRVEQCQNAYSREEEQRARDAIQALYFAAHKVKQKLRYDRMDLQDAEEDDKRGEGEIDTQHIDIDIDSVGGEEESEEESEDTDDYEDDEESEDDKMVQNNASSVHMPQEYARRLGGHSTKVLLKRTAIPPSGGKIPSNSMLWVDLELSSSDESSSAESSSNESNSAESS
ncbi:hypothetical protein KR044_005687 [Drosophila immigrans]|nr:hypothetical protein KR044_005687 [Drosophila immigrans]